MHYLYKITNLLDQKVYIGQTNSNNRWRQHKYNAKNPERTHQYIHRAMAKYKIENFIYEVIATCMTQEDANEIESILIKQYNSKNKNFGYNLTIGSDYGGHSEETREKLRKLMFNRLATKGHPSLGQKRTPEQKENISKGRREHPVIYTPEIRKRISESQSKRIYTPEEIDKRNKAVREAYNKIQEIRSKDPELKCHAPDCNIRGIQDYLIVDNIRYCEKHGQRLKRLGSLDSKYVLADGTKVAHNKTKFTNEQILSISNDLRPLEHIAKDYKVSQNVIVRIKKEVGTYKKSNKKPNTKFSSEQIQNIVLDNRSMKAIARFYGVTDKVIKRIKLLNKKLP